MMEIPQDSRHLAPSRVPASNIAEPMSLSFFFSIISLLIWTLPLYPGDDCIQEMKHRRNYRGTSSIWFNPFSFISLIPKSSCRPWAWGNIPDGLIPDGITSYLVQSLYIWKQKWVPLSSETRRTPESAPVRHHEFHLRSIWLNISFKVIWSTY